MIFEKAFRRQNFSDFLSFQEIIAFILKSDVQQSTLICEILLR